jgi:TPR repeat protein
MNPKPRLFLTITIPVACVAVIVGAVAAERVYKSKADERRLADDARVCRIRAEAGDARSEYGLAQMYYYGLGVSRDYSLAAQWERKAADQGYANAEYGLGYLYYLGNGLPQDYGQALLWFGKAADQGYPTAEYEVGSMYAGGKGVPQNYPEAIRWFRLAGDQGDKHAEYELGSIYYHAQGVPQDSTQAARWFRKAADQGYAQAESWTGFMLYYGHGVALDRAEANRWFRKAADQGNKFALRSLGYSLNTSRKVTLVVRLIAGIWLALSFLSLNSFEPGRKDWDSRQRLKTGTGVLLLFVAAMGWYGYTYFKIRPLTYGFDVFTWSYWLLNVTGFALLVYIVRTGKPAHGELNSGPADGFPAGFERRAGA